MTDTHLANMTADLDDWLRRERELCTCTDEANDPDCLFCVHEQ